MITIKRNNGTVSRTHDLRAMNEYANKHRAWVVSIELVRRNDNSGDLYVEWSDNASGYAHFASYTVMHGWVARKMNRRDSWWHGAKYSESNEGDL